MIKPWTELIDPTVRWEGITEADFGPNCHLVVTAAEVVFDVPWFEKVGQSLDDDRVVRVSSWEEAHAIMEAGGGYYHGHPPAAIERCREALNGLNDRSPWERAVVYIQERMEYPVDQGWTIFQQALLGDYLHDFAWYLAAEIMEPERTRSTYFREMLAWLAAGRFPCGWEGEWPVGKRRVF